MARSNNWRLSSSVMDCRMIYFLHAITHCNLDIFFFRCVASYAQKTKKGCENEAR
mgnify:CR=1 FL=1